MRPCPICHTATTCASHRQGWVERGPLTWCGVLPFRCTRCQTRFYRLAWRDPRRRRRLDVVESADRGRAPRYDWRVPATVITGSTDGRVTSWSGETENVSNRGAAVRLPTTIAVGCRVQLMLHGAGLRYGVVRWTEARDASWCSHGIELEEALGRHMPAASTLQIHARRRIARRVLLVFIGIGIIALTSAGLVWIMDALRGYHPRYYEPRDIERERHERQLIERDLQRGLAGK